MQGPHQTSPELMGALYFRRPGISLLVLFLLALTAEGLHAAQPPRLRGPGVEIFFEPSLDAAGREALELYPAVRADLERSIGWKVDFTSILWLIKERETFERLVGKSPVVAFALPRQNLIVIDHSKMRVHPFSIEVTLKHELAHLLLHHYIQRVHLPRWLDEGIAQWCSDGIGEMLLSGKSSPLPGAVLSGRLIDLQHLVYAFPSDDRSLYLAYEESKSLVEYIIDRFGREGLRAYLGALRSGQEWTGALESVFGLSPRKLQEGWNDWLRKRTSWFTLLSYHLYEILFLAAALLAVLGFLKALKKKRAYMKEDVFPDHEKDA